MNISGNKFLRINANESTSILQIRNDNGSGISVSTASATSRGISVLAQIGGWAIDSTGSHIFNQRSGETWSAPGVLWSARINGTSIEESWGNGAGTGQYVTHPSRGIYHIYHNLGNGTYTTYVTCVSDWCFAIVGLKYPTYCVVTVIKANNSATDAVFNFMIVGRPSIK